MTYPDQLLSVGDVASKGFPHGTNTIYRVVSKDGRERFYARISDNGRLVGFEGRKFDRTEFEAIPIPEPEKMDV